MALADASIESPIESPPAIGPISFCPFLHHAIPPCHSTSQQGLPQHPSVHKARLEAADIADV